MSHRSSSPTESPDGGILLSVLSLDRHRPDGASPDDNPDTEPLIPLDIEVPSEVLLIPKGRVSRFFHRTGSILFPLLYIVIAAVYWIVMYSCGLFFAPSFDPNWMLKLPYTSNAVNSSSTFPGGQKKLHMLRELSTWLSVVWSIVGPVILLCIASIRHDQVVEFTEQKSAALFAVGGGEGNTASGELAQSKSRSESAKWLAIISKHNYRSFWWMYSALFFSLLAGGFIRSRTHHLFYCTYLLLICIFFGSEVYVSDGINAITKQQQKFHVFPLSMCFLLYCFIVYFVSLMFIVDENLLAYFKLLSTISSAGLAFYIFRKIIDM